MVIIDAYAGQWIKNLQCNYLIFIKLTEFKQGALWSYCCNFVLPLCLNKIMGCSPTHLWRGFCELKVLSENRGYEEFILLLSNELYYWILKVSKRLTPFVLLHLSWTNASWYYPCHAYGMKYDLLFHHFNWILLELCWRVFVEMAQKVNASIVLRNIIAEENVCVVKSQSNYRYVSEKHIKSKRFIFKELFLTKQTTIFF